MEEKFIQLFAETLELEPDQHVGLDTVFRELPQWDSLAYLSLIAMIDEEFGLVIEGKVFGEFKTLGQIIEYIKKHQ